MFNLTRTMAGRRGIVVLAGLLTAMAAGVASAAPPGGAEHRGQRFHGVSRPVVGPHKGRSHGLHARGHVAAKRLYNLGYSAGKQAGWQAGYVAGRNGRPYAGLLRKPLRGRNVQYQLGFQAGYNDAYAQGYRQGRAACRPVLRFSFRW